MAKAGKQSKEGDSAAQPQSATAPPLRILIWDIETLPMEAYTWGLFKPYLSHDHIITEWTICCAAFKWLGEKAVSHVSVKAAAPRDDEKLIINLHAVLSTADVLVAHNGDKFDLRNFNARAIFYGLKPLPPIATIDTLKVARKHFGFSSKRLDYLGKHLFGEGKIHTDFQLWKDVLAGDATALTNMVAYCRQDVRLLERVYLRLRPWIRNHPNAAIGATVALCPTCGSDHYQHRGTAYKTGASYKRFQCMACYRWFSGERIATALRAGGDK